MFVCQCHIEGYFDCSLFLKENEMKYPVCTVRMTVLGK